MGIRKARGLLTAIEIIAAGALALVWDLLDPGAPGFPGLFFLPYWIPAVVFASFYGPALAYASLGAGVGMIAAAAALSPGGLASFPLAGLLNPASAFVAAAVTALGFGRRARRQSERELMRRYRENYKNGLRLARTLDAVKTVNAYYERQLLSSQDSLPLLHEYLRGLNTHSLQEMARGLLELTGRFASVASGAVYRYDIFGDCLTLVARSGAVDAPESCPLEGSIEGWTFRNASRFTIRQVLDDQYLAGMDSGRVVMVFPLSHGDETWGVFVVSELPFAFYTEANERAIGAMLELARPYLDRAVRFERLARDASLDERSGFLPYAQFTAMVEEAFAKGPGSPFSIVVCQVDNMRDILQAAGPGAEALCAEAIAAAYSQGDVAVEVCRYRRSDQLALIIEGLREDGVSRLTLEALAHLQTVPPRFGDRQMRLDLRIGFAARRKNDASADEMTGRAELLIEMQG